MNFDWTEYILGKNKKNRKTPNSQIWLNLKNSFYCEKKKKNQIFYTGISKLDNAGFFYLETVFSLPICLLI